MKEPSSETDRLLGAILSDEDLAGLRAASLDRMLEVASQRRQRRRVMRAVALGLPLLGLAIGLFVFLPSQRRSETVTAPQHPGLVAATTQPSVGGSPRGAGVRILTDDELLRFFPDHPAALIGPPGRQRLVFLDGSVSIETL